MEMHEIFKPENKSIKAVFGDSDAFYQIPDYQRPYSWEDEQIEALWDDVLTAFRNNKEDKKVDANYFLGSIILIQNGQYYDVVDGQQRLTTLHILFSVIKKMYPNLNVDVDISQYPDIITSDDIDDYIMKRGRLSRVKLKTSLNNQIHYEETIVKGINWPRKFSKKDKKENKYMNSALIFKEKIEELTEVEFTEFVHYLCNKVRLITITCTSQSLAIKLFQVLNARGMDLSAADMLKSFLLSRLHEDYHNEFITTWREIESTSKLLDESLANLFTYYLYYQIATNPRKNLYEELSQVIQESNKDSKEVVHELRQFISEYQKLVEMKNKYIYSLGYLRHQIYWRSILTTALHEGYGSFNQLVEAITMMYYKYWIAGYTSAKIKQISYNIIEWVKEHKDIDDIISEINEKMKRDSVDHRFLTNIRDNAYDEKWLKPLLIMIEYKQVDDSNLSNYILLDKKIHVEHVLPVKNQDIPYWNILFDKQESEEHLNKIYNLTLLSGTKNIQASNKSFPEKLDTYRGKGIDGITGFRITQNIADCYHKWNKTDMMNHKEWISKEIEKIFGLQVTI